MQHRHCAISGKCDAAKIERDAGGLKIELEYAEAAA